MASASRVESRRRPLGLIICSLGLYLVEALTVLILLERGEGDAKGRDLIGPIRGCSLGALLVPGCRSFLAGGAVDAATE